MKRKDKVLKKYFNVVKKSVDDYVPDPLITTSSLENKIGEDGMKKITTILKSPVSSENLVDRFDLQKDEVSVYISATEINSDDISAGSLGTAKSSSSSDELEEKETKVYEKVVDGLGNVKIIARNVKDTVKKKRVVTYREEGSLISQITNESVSTQSHELSDNEDTEDYELVEEEIEEEIEVEEEESEKETDVEEEQEEGEEEGKELDEGEEGEEAQEEIRQSRMESRSSQKERDLSEMESHSSQKVRGLSEMESRSSEMESRPSQKESGLAEMESLSSQKQLGLSEMESRSSQKERGLSEMESRPSEMESRPSQRESLLSEIETVEKSTDYELGEYEEDKLLDKEEEGKVVVAGTEEASIKDSKDEGKAIEQIETKEIGEEGSQSQQKRRKVTKKVIKKIIKVFKKKKSVISQTRSDSYAELKKESTGLLPGEKYEYMYESSQQDVAEMDETSGEKPISYKHRTEQEIFADVVKDKLLELQNLRRKNKMLHKSICQYYKQKNMTYVYQEEVPTPEIVKRYKRKLILLDEITQSTTEEKEKKNAELNQLKENLQKLENEYEKEFNELLQLESDFGKYIIDSKTGKTIDEELVKPLVRRHESVLKQLGEVRFKLIKFQKHFISKLETVKNFNCLEGNISIIDFEKLKMDNHLFYEKIEEREYELSNLRKKVLNVIHEYAHIIEKSDLLQLEIDEYNLNLPVIQTNVNALREYANNLKVQRDKIRNDTRNIKKKAGLVFKPRLAIDYEDSLRKLEETKIKLENTILYWNEQRSKIGRLRKLINDITFFS